jgi:hypothetical protein
MLSRHRPHPASAPPPAFMMQSRAAPSATSGATRAPWHRAQGDDRARLEDLAQRAGVAERVRFLGAVSQQYLAESYSMADVFVMPSTGEGFGIVFLEAMASGTPTLGLNAAGASDPLADGELGTVVSEDGAKILSRKHPAARVPPNRRQAFSFHRGSMFAEAARISAMLPMQQLRVD